MMEACTQDTERRLATLEAQLRRTRLAVGALTLALGAVAATGFIRQPQVQDTIRAHRFLAVDDSGRVRARLGEDPPNTQRLSRAAGLIIYDRTGAERGGFGTSDDGAVTFGMDAPVGVGAAMRDRLGLRVGPDGSAYVMLIDNETKAVAKLQSDGRGGGGVQVFSWDMPKKIVRIRTLTYGGDVRDSTVIGQ